MKTMQESMNTLEKSMKTVEQSCKGKTAEMPASSACRFHENDVKTMDKEKFEVQNAANTVEIAASKFKMLQIARKMDRTVNPKKNP